MPPLKDATTPPANLKDMVPVSPGAGRPSLPPPDSNMPDFDVLSLAPAPAVFSTEGDRQRQFYRRGVSQYRIPPMPSKANPGPNAAAAGVSSDQIKKQVAVVAIVPGTATSAPTISVTPPGGTPVAATVANLSQNLDQLPDGATYARQEAGDLTMNRLDFSKALLNKHLGNIPDDATSSRYAVLAVDANRRPLVDFSQTHVNKSLDNVPDGAGRFSVVNAAGTKGVSAVDAANKALIDFSQAGHTNKTVDNIADGTTFGRVNNTALTGNNVDPSLPGVLAKGSIPPALNNSFSYTSTTSSITWAWNAAQGIWRIDGTVNALAPGSQACTSLPVPSIPYFFYPFFDEVSQTLKFVQSSDVTFPTIAGYAGNGTTGYVSTTTSLSSPGSFSVSCWAKNFGAGPQPLFELSAPQIIGTAGNMVFLLIYQSSAVYAQVYIGTTVVNAAAVSVNLNDGLTHHIAFTWDNTAFQGMLYIDGISTTGSVQAGGLASLTGMYWHVGGCNGKTGWIHTANAFATSVISKAVVWSSVLTASQMQVIYQAGVNISEAAMESATSAVAPTYYWKLNETSGTTAADSAGSNTGTYQGTVTLNQAMPTYGAVGSPAIAWRQKTYLASQVQNNRTHIVLSSGAISGTDTAGGSGGGGGTSGGGGGGCFSPNTRVLTHRGDIPFSDLNVGDLVFTAAGTWRPVKRILIHDWTDKMLDMGDGEFITYKHHVLEEGIWQPGIEVFDHARAYNGKVYNLEVDTDEPSGLAFSPMSEHSYQLSNRRIAHNAVK